MRRSFLAPVLAALLSVGLVCAEGGTVTHARAQQQHDDELGARVTTRSEADTAKSVELSSEPSRQPDSIDPRSSQSMSAILDKTRIVPAQSVTHEFGPNVSDAWSHEPSRAADMRTPPLADAQDAPTIHEITMRGADAISPLGLVAGNIPGHARTSPASALVSGRAKRLPTARATLDQLLDNGRSEARRPRMAHWDFPSEPSGSPIPTRQRLDELLTNSSASAQTEGSLAQRLLELAALARNDPEMALGLAVSLYEQWDQPQQSERILTRLLSLADDIAGRQGLEARVTVIRWFLQRIDRPVLRHRVQLRLGRLYYTSGDFGKAAVELPVDQTLDAPDRYQSLAGLYKAVSLIRVQQPKPALPLLERVATCSPVLKQRMRAALLLGRLHALYQQPEQARPWLQLVADRTGDADARKQARRLLDKLNLQAKH